MADQAEHVEAPVGKPEQGADAHVVEPRLVGPAQSIEPPPEVALGRSGRVDRGVRLVVVGFHEDLVRPDARRLDGPEAAVIQGRGVDVHPTDLPASATHVVDVTNTGGDEVRVVMRVLAEHDDEALVPLVLHGRHLLADLIHAEGAAEHVSVAAAKPAVRPREAGDCRGYRT